MDFLRRHHGAVNGFLALQVFGADGLALPSGLKRDAARFDAQLAVLGDQPHDGPALDEQGRDDGPFADDRAGYERRLCLLADAMLLIVTSAVM